MRSGPQDQAHYCRLVTHAGPIAMNEKPPSTAPVPWEAIVETVAVLTVSFAGMASVLAEREAGSTVGGELKGSPR